jgi:hypothetical protein
MRPARLLAMLGLAVGISAMPVAAGADGAFPPPGAVEAELNADLGGVSLRQAAVLRTLIRAAQVIDHLHDAQQDDNGFYPADMSREEFERWRDPAGRDPYTVVRRGADGALEAVPYHEAWSRELSRVARLLAEAAAATRDEALRHYLTLRARALITGDYGRAETAWSAMRDSDIDVLIGPIGRGADPEFRIKAGFGAYVMLRDWGWGARLAAFTVFLPKIQDSLPVSPAFRAEVPDVDMKMAVYDLLFHAGAVAGGEVPLQRPGRLQLRNVARARFDALVRPVADLMIVPGQRPQARFDAWFLNAMFHDMAQRLGLRDTVTGRGPVRLALGEHADTIEETKAAVLSLWIAQWLHDSGELPETLLAEHYTSFLADGFRAAHLDPHGPAGRARMLVLNYFRDWGAFRRDGETGRYHIDTVSMAPAIEALAAHVLTIQGSGDREGAAALIETMAQPRADTALDLERLAAAGVPANVIFRPGEALLGL